MGLHVFRINLQFVIISAIFAVTFGVDAKSWNPEVWENIPGDNLAKIYIFNVTNADKYDPTSNLVKPEVKEVGPYVYFVTREKFNVTEVSEDGSFYYLERKSYEFQPLLSQGRSEDDLVNIVNDALIIFGTRSMLYGSYMFKSYFTNLMQGGQEFILRNQRVGDVLFNGRDASAFLEHEEELISFNNDVAPPGGAAFADGRFGLLHGTNGSPDGLLRVKPRAANSDAGQVISYNDESPLSTWKGDDCNRIIGTDGSVFGPGITSDKSQIDVFLPEIVRSVPLSFKEAMELGGVPGHRYTFATGFLEDKDMRPENACYCSGRTDQSACTMRGAMDLEAAKEGAPYVLSLPDFLKAERLYGYMVDGMIAASSEHESFYDIEPKTGTVLQSKKRFQWNIRVGPIRGNDSTSYLNYFEQTPEYLFPIFWMEQSFRLDGDILVALRQDLGLADPEPEEPTPETPMTETTATIQDSSIETTVTIQDPSVGTTTTTAKPEEVTERTSALDNQWISNRLDSINLHLIFMTFIMITCVVASIFCLMLLVRASIRDQRSMRIMELPYAIQNYQDTRKSSEI